MAYAAPNLSADPFDPADPQAYAAWRASKLASYPRSNAELTVPVADPGQLSAAEHTALVATCQRANFAIYQCARPEQVTKADIAALGRQLGLTRLDQNLCADNDSISSVTVMNNGRQQTYIPYSDRPLNWHTDGYYNSGELSIRAFILHCVQPAATGGSNQLLDPEIAYLLLRDADPEALAALMHPNAMAVPANEENGQRVRDEQTGPVFSVDPDSRRLHMRYTARTRSIRWHDDTATERGRQLLESILNNDSEYHFERCLSAGEGIVCNNILHTRRSFSDASDSQRLMYRARYYDRIMNTGLEF